jgi:uncharacterized protein DUF2865
MTGVPSALVLVAATVAIAAAAVLSASHHRAAAQPNARALAESSEPVQPAPGGSTVVKAGLFDWLFGGSPRREERPEPRPRFEQAPPPFRGDRPGNEEPYERGDYHDGGTFSTLCVRLCDGFYFPISYATRRDSFADDVKRCEQRCPSRSRLFVHRNPGEGAENMVDLEGHPYRDLPNAFQHLTRYDADCTCHDNPWDEAALARHRVYAQEAERKGADQVAQQSPAAQPQRRATRQSPWGYRDRRPRREWGNRD